MSDPADSIGLLQRLIACPSVTPHSAGALDLLDTVLTGLGFAVTRLSFAGDGSYEVENLFATRGSGAPHLLFAGHTDVVPPGDESAWSHPPFSGAQVDGVIHGRGAVDMKSGIAAFVAALAQAPNDLPGTISLAITNDEEADGINGTDKILTWAKAQGHVFDFAVVGEPSATAQVGDSIKIGRRGSLSGVVTVKGVQGHVAYPEKACNPLPVLAALAVALSDTQIDAGNGHFPASNLEVTSIDVGNGTGNLIPAEGRLRFNIRFNDGWTPETLERWVAERIAAVPARGTTIAYQRLGRPSPSFLSPLGGGVQLMVRTIEAMTGQTPQLSTGGGTSDARFIARDCPVVECGLPGPTMHKVNEQVPVADVVALTALYRAFITAYCTGATD